MKYRYSAFLVLGIHLFLYQVSSAQEIRFEHLTTKDGLLSNNVQSIVQDRLGFVWLATYEGLYRYDGYNLTSYRHESFDSTSISDNLINFVHEDPSGILWIGTWGNGLDRFDPVSGVFQNFNHSPNDSTSLSNYTVNSIVSDEQGHLWVATEKGLNRLDTKTNQIQQYYFDPNDSLSLSHNVINDLFIDSSNRLWVGTYLGGLNLYVPELDGFLRYTHQQDNPESLSSNYVSSIKEDHAGNLWLGTDSGLNCLDPNSGKVQRFEHDPDNANSLSNNQISAIHIDKSGLVWIGFDEAGHGIDRFDPRTQSSSNYSSHIDFSNPSKASLSSILLDEHITTMYEDQGGLLWIGTNGGGVSRFSLYKEGFTLYRHDPSNPHSLSGNNIRGLIEDDNNILWIGVEGGGLNRLDRNTGTIRHFRSDPDNPQSLSDDKVQPLYKDQQGYIWVGTFGGGLNRFDPSTEIFTHFFHDPEDLNSLSHNFVTYLYGDRHNNMWISTWGGGLNWYNPETGQFKQYRNDPDDPLSLSYNWVLPILESRDGRYWIGTFGGGLNRFDPITQTFSHLRHNAANRNSLSDDRVLSLYEEKDGTLWIGTSNGLNRYDPQSKTFQHFREKDGLSNNTIYGIVPGGENVLWISTRFGLSRLDVASMTFVKFTEEDGLQDNEYNSISSLRAANGELFFGGINGLNLINPSKIRFNTTPPQIVFTSFSQVGGQHMSLDSSITYKKNLVLSHKNDLITLEVAALNFMAPNQNQYAYRLGGLDNSWVPLGKKRDIIFSDLSPGKYTLFVKGSNNDGYWNEQGTSLQIEILPPYWDSWWFRITLPLILVGAAILVYRRRMDSLKQRQGELETQVNMRTQELEKARGKAEAANQAKSRFLANISHEVRNPLTLIIGPLSDLVEQRLGPLSEKVIDHIQLVQENANRLHQLINNLLDLSELEEGQLKPNRERQDLIALLRYIVSCFSLLAEQKEISLQLITSEKEIVFNFDASLLERVFANLLSNAFKYTYSKGKITVSIELLDQDKVEVSIRDSGVGIPEKHIAHIFDRFYRVEDEQIFLGTGIGLAYAKELVELHGGNISVESDEGYGSTFYVVLPIARGKGNLLNEHHVSHEHSGNYANIEVSRLLAPFKCETNALADVDRTTILVVDDDRDVRQYISMQLRSEYNVIEASSGEEAQFKVRTFLPDLVVCDVVMPGIGGFEFLDELKADPKINYIPVIMLTANIQGKIEGLQRGADEYLSKPLDLLELKLRVNNLLTARKNLQSKFSPLKKTLIINPVSMQPASERFLARLQETIEEHLSDEEFSVESLAEEMGQSRVTLYRKVKELLGHGPSELIQDLRLQRAKQLIDERAGNVGEIAYGVGFKSISHFSKAFRQRYGTPPSSVLAQKGETSADSL